ncbi:glycerate kinase type-2 family protein [Planctomycetes bacterium K23_9]|uniref:Hydroxypyruvate reductase n=1 Tax=Stieleria marina TaxID=1930275 RepID=A0A517NQT5_9BACT|nr:Putative hydroxypyruvate reductase [Planctomycetes bacterium K23_9]
MPTSDSQVSRDAVSIWNASVDAVRARPLVSSVVHVDGQHLIIGKQRWDLSQFKRIVVVGAGKAATAMASGLTDALAGCLPTIGWINVPEGTETPMNSITVHPARPAGVNEPTQAGVTGTQAILDLVQTADQTDLCIALISGGGSALLPAPANGISLADKQSVTRFLSGAGANIGELNTVRKHLSRIKGGGLLRACRAGELITLVLSDVLGDPLDLIASGPTVPDTSTAQDAINVLDRYDKAHSLPANIRRVLETATTTSSPQSTYATTLVIGNNQVAVGAAGELAVELGYETQTSSADQCEGEAESLGQDLAEEVLKLLDREDFTQPICQVSGGEPTVILADSSIRGKGGRNQQLVLAAYLHLQKQDLTPEQWNRIAILSGGTDGEDGPTDAAGAFINAAVHQQIVQQRLDGQDFLRRNDAYHFFQSVGGLLTTGPTGTNVCDVRVLIVLPA